MAFKDWYEQNKLKLAQTRKIKYHTDFEYRQVVRDRAADYRDRVRAEKPVVQVPGLTVAEVCEELGVSEWTISSWRERKYYPEPIRQSGRIYFTASQLSLLSLIKQFFEQYPRRLAGLHREELKSLVDVVHHNWSA